MANPDPKPFKNPRQLVVFHAATDCQVITREEFARAMGQAGKLICVDKDFSVLVDLSVVR